MDFLLGIVDGRINSHGSYNHYRLNRVDKVINSGILHITEVLVGLQAIGRGTEDGSWRGVSDSRKDEGRPRRSSARRVECKLQNFR